MGLLNLFGGDSSSSSSQTTNNTDQSKAFTGPSTQAAGDLIQTAPTISVGEGNISNLTLTDDGAVKAATDLVASDLLSVTQVAGKITDNAANAVKGALDLANKARETDTQSVFGNFATIAKWLALAGAAYFIADSFSSKKKVPHAAN